MEEEKPTPVCMEPKKIKETLNNLKKDKNNFKSLILNFDTLDELDKLNLFLEYFYSENTYLLEDSQIALIKQTHPNKKTIKTDFIYETNVAPYMYNSYLEVYAKNGVKFNSYKSYTPAEIAKMVGNGDIVIEKSYERKPISKAKFLKGVYAPRVSLLHDGFYYDLLTEENIEEMKKQNPEVFQEMMNDINLDEIKQYYEQEYLPLYKKCLNYLAECAKVSVAKEQADRKTFNAQINKSYKTEQKIKKISEEITNTSKGR